MNIVFIVDEHHYKKWIGKTYYDLITYIRNYNKSYQINIFWSDEDINYVKDKILLINPKLIFIFETDIMRTTLKFDFILSLSIPKILCSLDMFYPNMFINDNNMKYINGIINFSKNTSIINTYQKLYPEKYIDCFNSRYINTDKFKDYKLEKIYDILIYGTRTFLYKYKKEPLEAIQKWIKKYEEKHNNTIDENEDINFYYLRSKLEKIILNYPNKYRIKILPEKCIYNATIANEELSQLINQSYLTVACSTIADILLHKYLEISASKSVILGNMPSDYKDLFEDNIVEVNEFMTDDEIISIIDNALADKKELECKANRLYEKVREEHSFENVIKDFDRLIKKIL